MTTYDEAIRKASEEAELASLVASQVPPPHMCGSERTEYGRARAEEARAHSWAAQAWAAVAVAERAREVKP